MSTDTLPDGWKRVKFGDIAESITERVDDPSAAGVDRYVGLEHLDPESTTIRRWGSPGDVESTKLRFYPGDVVYGRRRAYQRKLGVADFDGICSAHALVLRAKPKVCLPEFLPYFLQSDAFHQRALDISVGSLSPTINWKTLAVQEFALPPVEEQQQIAQLLKTCQSDHAAVRRAVNAVEALTTSLVSEMAWKSGRSLRPIQEVWSGAQFFDGDWIESKDQAPEGIRLLQLADIGSGRFLDKSARFVSPATFDRLRCSEVEPGDFLISRMADPIGRTCLVPELACRLITVVDACVVRAPGMDPAEAAYWVAVLNSPPWTRACERAAGGTTRTRVSRSKLERIGVPDVSLPERVTIGEALIAIGKTRESLRLKESSCRSLISTVRESNLRGDKDVH